MITPIDRRYAATENETDGPSPEGPFRLDAKFRCKREARSSAFGSVLP